MSVIHIDTGAVEAAMQEQGRSATWLAKACGVSTNNVNRFLTAGKVQDVTLWRIEDALGLPSAALMQLPKGQLTTGQSLRLTRMEARLSVFELAARAFLSAQTIAGYERDKMPSLGFAWQVAKAMDMSIEQVFFRENK